MEFSRRNIYRGQRGGAKRQAAQPVGATPKNYAAGIGEDREGIRKCGCRTGALRSCGFAL